jgi:hypothetical protein
MMPPEGDCDYDQDYDEEGAVPDTILTAPGFNRTNLLTLLGGIEIDTSS